MGFEEDKKRQTDLDDLNNETAGREVGRQTRFLGGSGAREIEAKREKEEREFRSLLDQMLQDPEYRRLYDDASNAIDAAQSALDRALLENAQAQERLSRLIENMESSVATLANGEKVFRAEDGSLYTASGRRLTSVESRDVVIPPNAPSYESYVQANEALDKARERGRSLAEHQTRDIDPARARLQDENNPPTEDELRSITRDMERVTADISQSSAPSFQAAANAPATQAVEPPLEVAALDQIPTL